MTERNDEHCCFICGQPFKAGEMVLQDVTEGLGHRSCFGEGREGYVYLDTSNPLADGDPLPTGLPYDPAEFADPAPTERKVSSERVSALPPFDGLEVVGVSDLVERLDYGRCETANQWGDEYEPRSAWEKQVSRAMREWDRASKDAAEALSQASSVIAGLKAEVADLRDEWQAEYDARLAANAARRAAEARISSLEEENKRLREALGRAMDWIGAAPHDDHCFTNDPNPDACRCVCGKDTLLDTLEDHNG